MFYPDGLDFYNRAKTEKDNKYLKAPHYPRELLMSEHLDRFLMEYIRDLKNDRIEILVDQESYEFLE